MNINIIEKLLENNVNEIKEEVIISKRIGLDNKFTIKALTNDEVAMLRKRSITFDKNGKANVDVTKLEELSCITACVNPDFTDADLIKKAGAGDAVGLLRKALLPGEIDTLYKYINRISGYEDDINEVIETTKKL